MKSKRIKYKEEELPLYCNYFCKYADFTEPECTGACRRDIAIYCKILNRYNNKHARCIVRKNNFIRNKW